MQASTRHRLSSHIGVAACLLVLAGCAARIEGAWKDPQAPAMTLQGARVLVACEAYEPLAQRLCEERMAAAVTERGATPILLSQSGGALPATAERSMVEAYYLSAARNTAATAVLATNVTLYNSDYAGFPGTFSFGIGGFNFGRGGSGTSGGVGVSMPMGGYGRSTGYTLATRITDAATGRLLWTAQASAPPSQDIDAQLTELTRSMVTEAAKAGMF